MSTESTSELKSWHEYYVPVGLPIIPLADLFDVRPSAIQGEGVYAKQWLPDRYALGEIVGPLCPEPYDSPTCVVYNDDACLEPTDEGVPVHRMNHSCDPNCEIDFIDEAGYKYALVVLTARSVREGEELTIDYDNGTWDKNSYVDAATGLPKVCRCGPPSVVAG